MENLVSSPVTSPRSKPRDPLIENILNKEPKWELLKNAPPQALEFIK